MNKSTRFRLLFVLAAMVITGIIVAGVMRGKRVDKPAPQDSAANAALATRIAQSPLSPVSAQERDQSALAVSTRQESTAAAAKNSTVQSGRAVSTELVLLGTSRGSVRETFALIRQEKSRIEGMFRPGESVFGLGKLLRVGRERVEIECDGNIVSLTVGQSVASVLPAEPSRGRVESAAAKPAEVSTPPAAQSMPMDNMLGDMQKMALGGVGKKQLVERKSFNRELDKDGQLLNDIQLRPVSDSAGSGMTVSGINPDGLFGQIGLQDGDLLLRINNNQINSRESVRHSFQGAGSGRIKVDLLRNGQPFTYYYDLQ